MTEHAFTIIASGIDPNSPNFEDKFFEAGCDDATISLQRGRLIIEFSREAKTMTSALVSAVRDVQQAGAKIEHIEPDFLVSLSDIAARTGVTKAAVSLYAKGARGQEFPSPISRVTSETPLWDWVEVARWFFKRKQLGLGDLVKARVVRRANEDILSRMTSGHRGHALERRIAAG